MRDELRLQTSASSAAEAVNIVQLYTDSSTKRLNNMITNSL